MIDTDPYPLHIPLYTSLNTLLAMSQPQIERLKTLAEGYRPVAIHTYLDTINSGDTGYIGFTLDYRNVPHSELKHLHGGIDQEGSANT